LIFVIEYKKKKYNGYIFSISNLKNTWNLERKVINKIIIYNMYHGYYLCIHFFKREELTRLEKPQSRAWWGKGRTPPSPPLIIKIIFEKNNLLLEGICCPLTINEL